MPPESFAATDCPSETAFAELVEGSLAEPAAAQLRRHVERCGTCRDVLDALTKDRMDDSKLARSIAPAFDADVEIARALDPTSLAGAEPGASARGEDGEPAAPSVRVKRVIADRFEIVRFAGAGGMGRVYEARDLLDGATVALKLLNDQGGEGLGRFVREARVLAGLRHPGVVRYVAHGTTDDGEPWLVMDWLEGETLSARLRRSDLDVHESVALAQKLAAALGAVHRAGVVHRDLKPSNVFLVGRSVEQPRLIDFGIARDGMARTRLTYTGAMLGTPGYMAPEQAKGEPGVDARADLFSLGCLLFKCLTGRDAFTGTDALSVLLKVVYEAPPRVRELRGEVSPALDGLVARLLAKEKDDRPRDGDAAAAELSALDGLRDARKSARPAELSAREITEHERRLMCLLLVHDAVSGARPDDAPRRRRALHAAAERHRGRVEALAEDAVLVLFSGEGAPTDLTVHAARCALSIRAALDGARVSLVTGRAEIAHRLPVGELIDRAVHLLAPDPLEPAPSTPDARAPIRVDEVTAGLLGARFDVRAGGEGSQLHGEHDASEPAQVLLGRPTSCVGRDRELSLLELTFSHTVQDSTASAVLVTGAAGVGKSRLRHELLRRLRERGEPFDPWIGHGDPMSAGSAFGLLGRALRRVLGVGDGDALEARRDAIRRGTAALADPARVAAFLGELTGAPFPEETSAQLRAARRDPVLMGDQMRRAAEDLLRARCAERPVVLVLEDLQWGDLPTVTFVDAALRNLAELPLLVLALARPEVSTLFPRLRAAQVVHLDELPRRAAERLVKQALGDAAPAKVAALVERAGGNAFYLEELIRAVAAGRDADLPETVLAMVQGRLEALAPDLRRVLRAASIFGRTFSQGAVEALTGGTPAGARLAELVEREVIIARAEAAEPAGIEYGFRHALMRDAAYGMLTEDDRAVGHSLAGAWLQREGKAEAMALAEHFKRGGDPERAATWYVAAAEQALEGDDLGAAIERAGQAMATWPGRAKLGEPRLIEAEARLWLGELALAEERANEAAASLAPGSAGWFRAVTLAALAAGKLGAIDRVEAWAVAAGSAVPAEGSLSARVVCLSACASSLALGGRYAAGDALIEQAAGAIGDPQAADAAQAVGRLCETRAMRAIAAGDPGACLEGFEAALHAYEQAGDRRSACLVRGNLGFLFVELGDLARGEEALRAALDDAGRMGLHEVTARVRQNLGYAAAQAGRLDEARRLQEQAVEMFRRQGNARMEGASRMYLAQLALLSGDADGAERDARWAAELLSVARPLRAVATAVLARALLRQRRAAEALAAAEEAVALLDLVGGTLEEGESLVGLAHAEALAAAGRGDEAARALAVARERLLTRAARISGPGWRESFLTQVPDNAATLAAAR